MTGFTYVCIDTLSSCSTFLLPGQPLALARIGVCKQAPKMYVPAVRRPARLLCYGPVLTFNSLTSRLFKRIRNPA